MLHLSVTYFININILINVLININILILWFLKDESPKLSFKMKVKWDF